MTKGSGISDYGLWKMVEELGSRSGGIEGPGSGILASTERGDDDD
ncbi:MAG: hypothetical protein ACP5VR_05260 [Acidimicrobiales bacterium]